MMCSDEIRKKMKRNCHGFTIIEALLAAILLAAGFVVLLTVVNRSVYNHSGVSAQEIAVMLADETLDRIGSGMDKLSDDNTRISGNFSANYPNYSWKAMVVHKDVGLLQVDLTVLWEFNGVTNQYSVSTLFYKDSSGI